MERPSADDGPDELAALRQELDSVAAALRRLTPDQREAIELRFFAGLSAKEAAVAMDRQEGTVRGLQFRAIAALRRDLGIEPARTSAGPGLGDGPGERGRDAGTGTARGRRARADDRALHDASGWIPARRQARRARAAVMEEAWRRRLAGSARRGRGADADAPRPRAGPFAAWGGRRVGVLAAAALIAGLMVGSSAFAASRAGGPLYDTRLSLEALTLPSDPSARLEAELALAQTRIAEIAEAASRGDDGAVDAAVRAYASTLADLDAETGTSAGRARDAVLLHQAVLRDLLLRVPTQAQAGIERAISNSTVAIDHLDQASHPPGTPAGAGGGKPRNRRRRQPQRGRRQPQRGGGNGNAGGGGGTSNGGGQPERGRRERRWRQRWWRQRWWRQPEPVAGTATVAATRTPVAGVDGGGNGGKPDRTPKPEPQKAPKHEPAPSD